MSTPGLPRSSTSATSGYEGERTRPLATATRDLAGRGAHLARARPRHGREGRALAPDRARARADGGAGRARRVPRLGADEPRRLRAAVVRRVLRVRDPPAGAVRRGRRAAARLSRPARRRALALRGPADHADGLRRLAVGVLHGRRWRASGRPRRCCSSGTCSTHEHRLVAPRQLGRRPAVLRRRSLVAVVSHDARAARRVVHDPARVRGDRDARRALHRLGDRRHRRGQLHRRRSRTCSRWPTLPQVADRPVHWIFGDALDRPVSGGSRRSGSSG